MNAVTPLKNPIALTDPSWLTIAKKYLGEKEIKGPHHNPHILRWAKSLATGISDDEVPWCGTYVGGVLREDGRAIVANPASARAWEKVKVRLDRPAVGAIVVFWREKPTGWKGHVGFVVGRDRAGNIMVLGGNQGDTVSIKPYARTGPNSRVVGYFWPGVYPVEERFNLPLIASDGKLVTKET